MLLGTASSRVLSAVKMEAGTASKSPVIKLLVRVLSLPLTRLMVDELFSNSSSDKIFIELLGVLYICYNTPNFLRIKGAS